LIVSAAGLLMLLTAVVGARWWSAGKTAPVLVSMEKSAAD
jgi:hypothetical protein